MTTDLSDDQRIVPPAASSKRRRLSITRVGVFVALTGAVVGGIFVLRGQESTADSTVATTGWAAPYVDVTIPPLYPFESPGDAVKDIVLSFVVAHRDEPCTPAWGGVFDLDTAAEELDLDRRVTRLRQTGKEPIVSFGGAINDELAVACTDDSALVDAYSAVIDRYQQTTIDLDIEGPALLDQAANERRGRAIAEIQEQRDAPLAVWITLPVSPAGLTSDGIASLDALLANGVEVAGVNGMVMNFAESRDGRTMSESVEDAVDAIALQVVDSWRRNDTPINTEQAYALTGATAMIGRNDVVTDVFTLDDATSLRDLAVDRGLGRLSYWSLNRDRSCGSNEEPIAAASNFCTHLDHHELAFAEILNDLPARAEAAAGAESNFAPIELLPDDAKTSPYPIWRPDRAYIGDSKIVWHSYVYEAKWWTQGTNPEEPVENSWDSPWQIIGPVLPDDLIEHVPAARGDVSEWDGDGIYDTGDLIWISGKFYEAKWWNTGFPPNRDVPNDWETPWTEVDPDDLIVEPVAEILQPD
ncbi:MAG: chitinase [Ilumatobacter sp.]|jgi:chitinase